MMKLTKKEKFAMVIKAIKGIEELETKDMLVEFLNHEVELLDKKSGSSKLTKVQKENVVLKNELYKALAELGKAVTIAEFKEKSNSELVFLSTSKLSALLNQMKDEPTPRIKREEIKKRAYFSAIVEESEEEEIEEVAEEEIEKVEE